MSCLFWPCLQSQQLQKLGLSFCNGGYLWEDHVFFNKTAALVKPVNANPGPGRTACLFSTALTAADGGERTVATSRRGEVTRPLSAADGIFSRQIHFPRSPQLFHSNRCNCELLPVWLRANGRSEKREKRTTALADEWVAPQQAYSMLKM